MGKPDLIADELRRLLSYDPQTGIFLRRFRTRGAPAPTVAIGSPNSDGYLRVSLQGKQYLLHRLAYVYMTGVWPSGVVDHIDGDRTNNAYGNLRNTTRAGNNQNLRKCRASGTSGYLGVHKKGDKWRAQITTDRKQLHLGTYERPEDAHEVYLAAKRMLHHTCTL